MSDEPKKTKCGCGRSQTGYCTGLHQLTNEEYKAWIQKKAEDDQA